jgi:thioredoxin reductase (NADPH)
MERIVIIGTGPAGISCAIMLKHLGINPVMLEKHKMGGLLRNAYRIKNYLGSNNITGKNLVKKFEKHLKEFKIKPICQTALKIDFKKYFSIQTDKKTFKSKFLVLATGTKPKKPNLKIPTEAKNKIFYDVADFPPVRNKIIAIMGAGDAAFDYALTLSEKNEVIILNRNHKPKCNNFLLKTVAKNKKIRLLKNFEIAEIGINGKKIILKGRNKISCDYLLIAIGRKPNYPMVTQTAFKNKNFYPSGDIKNAKLRQTAIAVSDGIKTAMKIYEKINRKNRNYQANRHA